MQFLENFYLKTLQYEIINKYSLNDTKNLPKFKKIILNFNYWGKYSDLKLLAISMLALELIANQKGSLTKTSSVNVSLRIKKGIPTGCKLTLQKTNNFEILSKIVQEVSPSVKVFTLYTPNKKINAFSFNIFELYGFYELEQRYHIFTELQQLDVTVVMSTKSCQELEFILKSIQMPINENKRSGNN